MLCTILPPSSGGALVNGYDIVKEANDVRRSIGIVFQTRALDDILTGREHLEMHAALYGVDKDVRTDRIEEVLELIALGKKADEQTKNYSGGMKRRLEIGRGLIHHPKLLFLDEPTLGLDIQTRESIWSYIENLKNNIDITILLTTHYLEEADSLCDEVAIMSQGEIVKSDSPKNLKAELKSDTLILTSPESQKLCELLEKQSFVNEIMKENDEVKILVEKGENLIPKVVNLSETNDIELKSIGIKHPSLEEVFVKYTGRTISDTTRK